MNIKRRGLYLAALDPVVGSEISKTRPVVVVSNEKNNEFSSTVTILPITSKNIQKIYPFEAFLSKGTGDLPKNSKAKADQIRTLDKNRIESQWQFRVHELPMAIKCLNFPKIRSLSKW
jgi:mRNA interferase MazF